MLIHLNSEIIIRGDTIPELPDKINERAIEALVDFEILASELLMLARYADSGTTMAIENAFEKIATSGLTLRKLRESDRGID